MSTKASKTFFYKDIEKLGTEYKISHVKQGKLKYTYFETYSFEKEYLIDNNDVQIIGDIKPWLKYKEDRKNSIGCIVIPEVKKTYNVFSNPQDTKQIKRFKFPQVIGYICIDSKTYVRILDNPINTILPTMFIILGLYAFIISQMGSKAPRLQKLLNHINSTPQTSNINQ